MRQVCSVCRFGVEPHPAPGPITGYLCPRCARYPAGRDRVWHGRRSARLTFKRPSTIDPSDDDTMFFDRAARDREAVMEREDDP